jgi:hypothetical protein
MKNLLIGLFVGFAFLAFALPVQAADKVIEFTWQHEDPAGEGVTSFKLYMSLESGANYVFLLDIPFESVEDTYMAEGTITAPDNEEVNRYFVCKAFDGQGNESDYSNEATVTIDNLPPGTPITFKAVVKVVTN